jgi:hypothetical protein
MVLKNFFLDGGMKKNYILCRRDEQYYVFLIYYILTTTMRQKLDNFMLWFTIDMTGHPSRPATSIP